MMKLFIMIAILGIHELSSSAQAITFPEDKNITAGSLTPMVIDNEVKGYFSCNWSRTIRKTNMTEYNLVIMDNNFKIVRDVNFQVDDYLRFKRRVYNGKTFCLTFFNENKGIINYYYFDSDGNKLSVYKLKDIKKKKTYPIFMDQLAIVPHLGFFRNGLNPNDENYCEMVGNDGKQIWKLIPKHVVINGKDRSQEELKFYYGDRNYLILEVNIAGLKADELQGQDNEFYRVYDPNTGRELFKISSKHERGFLVPLRIKSIEDHIAICGQFFDFDKSKDGYNEKYNLGIYIQEFDHSGMLVKENFTVWKAIFSKFMDPNGGEQLDENINIWIHEIINTAAGYYFAICELYASGTTAKSFNLNYAGVGDLLVLQFDSQFTLIKAEKYDKYRSTSQLKYVGFRSHFKLGEEIKRQGEFDYKFSSTTSDNEIFTAVYDNYDKSEKGNKKFVIGAVAFNQDHMLVNPKIVLTTHPDDIMILPAKAGYVAIIESFIKAKVATLTLYKFDM